MGIRSLTPLKANHAWTPLSESSLQLWLDPTDNGTITQSGSLVSTWNDKSTNAFSFTQATSTKQFTVTASAVNGLQGMASGTNSVMGDSSTVLLSTTSPWTFAVAGKITSYGSNGFGIMMGYRWSTGNRFKVTLSNLAGYNGFAMGIAADIFAPILYSASIPTGTVFKAVVTYSGSNPTSAASYEIYWNGVSQTVTTNSGGFGADADTGNQIGTDSDVPGYGLIGYQLDNMFFSSKSASLTSNINNFLSRWGV